MQQARSVDSSPVYRGGVPVKTHTYTVQNPVAATFPSSLPALLPPRCGGSPDEATVPPLGTTRYDAEKIPPSFLLLLFLPPPLVATVASLPLSPLCSSDVPPPSSFLFADAAGAASLGSRQVLTHGRRQAGGCVGRPRRMPVNTRSTLPGVF